MTRGPNIYIDGVKVQNYNPNQQETSSNQAESTNTNAVQLLVQTGHAKEVAAPQEWTDERGLAPLPVPPTLLETGTKVNEAVAEKNEREWTNLVEKSYNKKVNSNPALAFAEGIESIWPSWERPKGLSERSKVAFYTGNILGKTALGFLSGAALGEVLGNTRIGIGVGKRIASFGARHPVAMKAVSGTLKGAFVGAEAAKGIIMKEEGKSWTDVVGTVAGDFAGFYGFEKGFASRFVPKAAKEFAIERTHETSARHRVYLPADGRESNNFLFGKEYSASSEKPLIIDKGPRVKVMPDQERSIVGAVEMKYKGRFLGERPVVMRRFMTAGERATFGDRFPIAGIRDEEIFSGGLSAQMQIQKRAFSTMKYDTGFWALRKAMKEASLIASSDAMLGPRFLSLSSLLGAQAVGKVDMSSLFGDREDSSIRFEPMLLLGQDEGQELQQGQKTTTIVGTVQTVVPRSAIILKQGQEQDTNQWHKPVPMPQPPEPVEIPQPKLGTLPGLPQQGQKQKTKTIPQTRRVPLTSKLKFPKGKNPVLFTPIPFLATGLAEGGGGSGSIFDSWSVDNQWGDIKLGIESLKQQFKEIENMFGGKKSKKARSKRSSRKSKTKGASSWGMGVPF